MLKFSTGVMLVEGSMMPRSTAASQEAIVQLMQVGAFDHPDPDVKRMIFRAFDIGGLEKSFTEMDGQRRRAQIENMQFLHDDVFPDVEDHDDPVVHIAEHQQFMLTNVAVLSIR